MSNRVELADRIETHRVAWHTFMAAPAYGQGSKQPERRLRSALDAMLETPARSIEDVVALRNHLDWYVEAEGSHVDPKAAALLATLNVVLWNGDVGSNETWIEF